MFTATDVLNAAFIEQPLDKLWSLISPLYMADLATVYGGRIPMADPIIASRNAKPC